MKENNLIDTLDSGDNTFITGSAGTGKTYSIEHYRKDSSHKRIALTATTGVAALQLGGETIHRFSGIGIETDMSSLPKITNKLTAMSYSNKWWEQERWDLLQSIETIVVDEVSMLRRDQFELIDRVFRIVRSVDEPFGGIQMVFVGDFLQLPPVVTEEELLEYPHMSESYCFQSTIWKQAEINFFELTKHHRQKDIEFLKILECIRTGIVTSEVDDMMRSRLDAKLELNVSPLKLFPLRRSVQVENMKRLVGLPGEIKEYKAYFSGKEWEIQALKNEINAEEVLLLKNGAQIMCIVNDRHGEYVNGSMGIITNLGTDSITVELTNGEKVSIGRHVWQKKRYHMQGSGVAAEPVASMQQFPVKLAYASTIHKSQGMSLDAVEMDISNCFATGQAYVALSRVRSLEGLRLIGWHPKSVRADDTVLDFYRKMYL